MSTHNFENLVASHYDASAEDYHLQYERALMHDTNMDYPANYFRLHLLLNSFIENQVKNVIEVGVGEGTPLVTLSKSGMNVSGFDLSANMTHKCKLNFKNNGLDPDKIIQADIEDPITYSPLLKNGRFDALLAMGVMPHVKNEEYVINNMKNLVRPGGKVFIEFRNKIFSLFTFNKNTYDFILNDLLFDVDPALKELISKDISKRLEMDKPIKRVSGSSASPLNKIINQNSPGYDAIPAKFHNPFTILDLFAKCGFIESKLLWYHYHPAMPYLSSQNRQLFREEALKLEHENSNWRGLFLCSAFVVEAKTPGD